MDNKEKQDKKEVEKKTEDKDKKVQEKQQNKRSSTAVQEKKSAEPEQEAFVEKVVNINRVAKVVKGGRRFSFSALVVVGDGKGKFGYCLGKANEVASAIRKGSKGAKRDFLSVSRSGDTIPHEVIGEYGAARVLMKPGSPGTGIIAGGPVRAVCEACGIKDIRAKRLGSPNAINVIKATIDGFSKLSIKKDRFESEE